MADAGQEQDGDGAAGGQGVATSGGSGGLSLGDTSTQPYNSEPLSSLSSPVMKPHAPTGATYNFHAGSNQIGTNYSMSPGMGVGLHLALYAVAFALVCSLAAFTASHFVDLRTLGPTLPRPAAVQGQFFSYFGLEAGGGGGGGTGGGGGGGGGSPSPGRRDGPGGAGGPFVEGIIAPHKMTVRISRQCRHEVGE